MTKDELTINDWLGPAPRPKLPSPVPPAGLNYFGPPELRPRNPTRYLTYDARRKRLDEIVQLHRKGMTFGDIGLRFQISSGRAHQLWIKGIERENRLRIQRNIEIYSWHHKRLTRLGRPLDMGGPRGVWLEFRLGDGQTIGG